MRPCSWLCHSAGHCCASCTHLQVWPLPLHPHNHLSLDPAADPQPAEVTEAVAVAPHPQPVLSHRHPEPHHTQQLHREMPLAIKQSISGEEFSATSSQLSAETSLSDCSTEAMGGLCKPLCLCTKCCRASLAVWGNPAHIGFKAKAGGDGGWCDSPSAQARFCSPRHCPCSAEGLIQDLGQPQGRARGHAQGQHMSGTT